MADSNLAKDWEEVGDKLIRFPSASLEGIELNSVSHRFLTEVGLPDNAAPYVAFRPPAAGSLPSAADLWGLPQNFGSYRVIGSNGSGDPICIDQNDYSVVYLNHDWGFKPVLMNSDVVSLSQSLLEYRRLVLDTVALRGSQAFIDGDIATIAIDLLEAAIRRIDTSAFAQDAFWPSELAGLRKDVAEFERTTRR